MSEKPPESAPEAVEPQGLPTPAVSPPSAPPTSAPLDADALVSRIEASLLPKLQQYVDRSTQSVKDKRIAGIQSNLENLKAALDAHGGDINKAARELAVDELLRERTERSADLGKVGEDWETGVAKILKEAEESAGVKVPLDDPELQAAAKGSYATWADAYAAINRVVLRRARNIPATAVPGEVRGTPTSNPTVDELTDQLTKLMRTGAPLEAISAAKQKLLERVQAQ